MRKFSDILEEYLDIRERLSSDYYDGRYIGERTSAKYQLQNLAKELDDIIEKVNK